MKLAISAISTCLFLIILSIDVEAQTLDGLDRSIIYGHQIGGITTSAEDAQLDKMFTNMDVDFNGKVSKNEFSDFMIPAIFDIGTLFDKMDLNQDGKLDYIELVYDEKLLIELDPDVLFDETLNPTFGDLADEFANIVPGTEYNDETHAEFLASILLFDVDNQGNNDYVTRVQFIDDFKTQEWIDIAGDNDITDIDITQFKQELFNTDLYRGLQNLELASQADLDKIDLYIQKLDEAHATADVIIAEQEKLLVFNAHDLDDELKAVDGSRRRRLLSGWFRAARTIRYGVSATRSANGGCYYDYNMIYELNKGPIYIKDLSVGDYVYDGNHYTKLH